MLDPRALSTNEVLPDDDRNQLVKQRAAARSELALLDAQIALTELELVDNDDSQTPPSSPFASQQIHDISNRRRRRKTLTSLISAYDTALAPHKYLPAELLAYIFTLAFNGAHFPTHLPPPPTPRGRNGGSTAAGTPLALCHTCSRWRIVALNTPELWTDVVLLYTKATDPYRTMSVVEEWFARAGSTKPLSLTISRWSGPRTCGGMRKDHADVLGAFFERLVLPNTRRFRQLSLCLAKRELVALLNMPALSFTLLESISLAMDRDNRSTPNPTKNAKSPFLTNAPRLTDFELNNFGRRIGLWTRNLCPYEKLTRFRCTKTPLLISECHSILKRCRRLVDCHLDICGLSRTNSLESPSKRIELPLLSTLHIEFDYESQPSAIQTNLQRDVEAFFEPLYLPNLKELSISFAQWRLRTFPHQALVTFLTRSCCELEGLKIADADLEAAAVSDLINALPSLKALHIGVDNLLPRTALPQMAAGELLPKLEFLVCRIDDLESMIKMLELRWKEADSTECDSDGWESPSTIRPSCLKFVMVEYVGARIARDQAVRVDRLRDNGVRIEMIRASVERASD
ncbi:unnamed protein product [Cyclocybe aegerita]|uniref:F-box domain-containing protein n=1 Tax=Cyclocybe aegerita TaxID=1973307 RepID=A0A8S0WQ84_CYCAE|nr:unnamed protein product [Cyclocybe aegerita]